MMCEVSSWGRRQLKLDCYGQPVHETRSETHLISSSRVQKSRTVFFVMFLIKKVFCPAGWKCEWRADKVFFESQWDTVGLSITAVSGQTAPSHELPQTHLQKIRREIVWLLHHRGHLPPPISVAVLRPVCRGLLVSQRALPSGIPSFFRLLVFHTSQ